MLVDFYCFVVFVEDLRLKYKPFLCLAKTKIQMTTRIKVGIVK